MQNIITFVSERKKKKQSQVTNVILAMSEGSAQKAADMKILWSHSSKQS